MSLEIAAARLLAPYLGTSLYVWGTLISAVLAAMALGYALGGRLADRATSDRPLFGAIAAAGLYQVATPYWVHGLLATLVGWSELSGTLLGSLAGFGPPIVLLAGTAPFVIRLRARSDRVGTASGVVYGLATVGSIGGVLVTSFVMLPEAGTQLTLQLLAAVTLLVGVAGLIPHRVALAAVLAGSVALPLTPARTWPPNTVWVGESIYHTVRVVELHNARGLLLDAESGLHTALDAAGSAPGWGYWAEFAIGPALADGHDVLVLGMGGGASVRAVQAVDPHAQIDAVELDPLVVEVAAAEFDVRPGPGFAIHVGDARRFLASTRSQYDVIQADLFHAGPTVPFHLATVEFYRAVREHLRPGGVFMLNVLDAAPDRPVLGALAATLAEVFPTLYVRPFGGVNHIVLAFPEARSLESLRQRLRRAAALPAAEALVPLPVPAGTPPLTDDRAPLEALTARMLRSTLAMAPPQP